jgi:hypothetical protein
MEKMLTDKPVFRVGVTGTRSGMTNYQKQNVYQYLYDIIEGVDVAQFNHGDCIGVDGEAADIAMDLGYEIVCFPPLEFILRYNHKSDIIHAPQTYMKRNRDIVDNSDVMMAVPWEMEHQSKGGTWYTFDYSIKKKVPIQLFLPREGIIL